MFLYHYMIMIVRKWTKSLVEIVEVYLELCGLPFKPLVTKWRGFLAIYLKQKPKMLRN